MREPLTIYDPEARGIKMVPTTPFVGADGCPGVDRAPNHLRNTYNTEEELFEVVKDLVKDSEELVPHVIEHQEFLTDDAEVLIIAHGVVTRAVQAAIDELRKQGIKAGHFRPITLRPFSDKALNDVAKKA